MDELCRELGVRERCFPDWVKQGRVSYSDATDRYDRLKSAIHYLESAFAKQLVKPEGGSKEWKR
jgi:hypothetical protein